MSDTMRTVWFPGRERVAGSAVLGDIVVYEDRANSPRAFEVIALPDPTQHLAYDYLLREIDSTYTLYTDLRQHGWTFGEPA